MYAIIDVETTGSYAAGNNITEIAICVHDGKQPVEWFESLVRPDKSIPAYITALTGITNEMVADAPTFAELLPKIASLTQDKVFVAHHVHFDYTFVRNGFAEHGMAFDRKKLCTVRLSRKIIPGLPSYSLGRLCAELGITHKNAHRAMGDVLATVKLFEHLLGSDKKNFVQQSLNRNSGETILPANLPRDKFSALPEEPGVYYFKDGKGKIIYIGKAANIKKRVRSHFSGNDSSQKAEAFKRQIYDVQFKRTGTELVALLLEDSEIRKYWPAFNKAQKNPARSFGIYRYEDQQGYFRLGVNRTRPGNSALQTFGRMSDARNALSRLVDEFELCAALCGMGRYCEQCAREDKTCFADLSAQEYNQKVDSALQQFNKAQKKCAILGRGREDGEQSVVVMDGERYLGFGFLDSGIDGRPFEEIAEEIERYPESSTIRNILHKHLSNPGALRVVYF